jgi:hypothetical protein
MAGDAIAFVQALGLSTVDLLGFSLGGMGSGSKSTPRPSTQPMWPG